MPDSQRPKAREALSGLVKGVLRAHALCLSDERDQIAEEVLRLLFDDIGFNYAALLVGDLAAAENARLRIENERVQREAGRMLREAEKRIPASPPWSPEWPTREGWYWFYGKRHRIPPDLVLCSAEVKRRPNGTILYLVHDFGMTKGDGAEGLWLPLPTPELPEVQPCPTT